MTQMFTDTDNVRHQAKLNIWLAMAKLRGLRRRASRKAIYSIAADLCDTQAGEAMAIRFFDSARDLYLARDYLRARLSTIGARIGGAQ